MARSLGSCSENTWATWVLVEHLMFFPTIKQLKLASISPIRPLIIVPWSNEFTQLTDSGQSIHFMILKLFCVWHSFERPYLARWTRAQVLQEWLRPKFGETGKRQFQKTHGSCTMYFHGMEKKSCQTSSSRIWQKKSEFRDFLGKEDISYNLIHVKSIQLHQQCFYYGSAIYIYIFIYLFFRKKNKELYRLAIYVCINIYIYCNSIYI